MGSVKSISIHIHYGVRRVSGLRRDPAVSVEDLTHPVISIIQ